MSHAPRSVFAVLRRLALPAVFGTFLMLALAGCGGNGTSSMPTPSPPTSVPGGEPGRGGALADGCSRAGLFITQPGWSGQCSTAIQPKRKWTVLLYISGANDLEEYGNLNLNQIERFGSDENVTFVAQFKRIPESAQRFPSRDDKSDGDWTGTRRFVVRRDEDTNHVSSPVVSQRSDADMGDPGTLREFVDWGVKTFPAEHYAIVLWSHGSGWRNRSIKQPVTRGFSYDDEKGSHIDTVRFAEAIQLEDRRKWDIVAWDACLMQVTEVAYQIRNEADWVVGAEEETPAPGYPYHLWVDKLIANPDADGRFVGEAICDAMVAGYPNESTLTQSLVDTSQIARLVAAVNDFGASLLAAKPTFGPQIADAREYAEYFQYYENKDLIDFARLTREKVGDPGVQAAAVRVEEAVRAAVVKNISAAGHPNAHGIALYIPSPGQYRRDDVSQANGFGQRYTELLFAKNAPNWQSFLTQGPP